MSKIRIGLARMHQEPGERRDFLPDFVANFVTHGAEVFLEHNDGCGIGMSEAD